MKPTSKIKLGAVVVLIIALFVVLNLTGLTKPLRGFFYNISSSLQASLWGAGSRVSDFFETIGQMRNLKEENEKLKLQNQELSAQITILSELKKENETLRNALGIGLEKDFRLVLAQVISKEVGKDVISINKGAKDGMAPGMPVISEQKVLIGKITETGDNFSKVALITDKDSSFNAKIFGTDTEGVLKGGGDFSAFLDLLPREAEIKIGDQVVTSVLGGVFPEGLLVGTVSEVDKNDVESFQKAKIQPSFDIKELNNLFIIVNL